MPVLGDAPQSGSRGPQPKLQGSAVGALRSCPWVSAGHGCASQTGSTASAELPGAPAQASTTCLGLRHPPSPLHGAEGGTRGAAEVLSLPACTLLTLKHRLSFKAMKCPLISHLWAQPRAKVLGGAGLLHVTPWGQRAATNPTNGE